ncbi:hypothetical protein HY524_00170 [Candidatus Berkelbacteria bacterium]|nr:hypothetical protein [Candidatus Berkelbacteria bacterium]
MPDLFDRQLSHPVESNPAPLTTSEPFGVDYRLWQSNLDRESDEANELAATRDVITQIDAKRERVSSLNAFDHEAAKQRLEQILSGDSKPDQAEVDRLVQRLTEQDIHTVVTQYLNESLTAEIDHFLGAESQKVGVVQRAFKWVFGNERLSFAKDWKDRTFGRISQDSWFAKSWLNRGDRFGIATLNLGIVAAERFYNSFKTKAGVRLALGLGLVGVGTLSAATGNLPIAAWAFGARAALAGAGGYLASEASLATKDINAKTTTERKLSLKDRLIGVVNPSHLAKSKAELEQKLAHDSASAYLMGGIIDDLGGAMAKRESLQHAGVFDTIKADVADVRTRDFLDMLAKQPDVTEQQVAEYLAAHAQSMRMALEQRLEVGRADAKRAAAQRHTMAGLIGSITALVSANLSVDRITGTYRTMMQELGGRLYNATPKSMEDLVAIQHELVESVSTLEVDLNQPLIGTAFAEGASAPVPPALVSAMHKAHEQHTVDVIWQAIQGLKGSSLPHGVDIGVRNVGSGLTLGQYLAVNAERFSTAQGLKQLHQLLSYAERFADQNLAPASTATGLIHDQEAMASFDTQGNLVSVHVGKTPRPDLLWYVSTNPASNELIFDAERFNQDYVSGHWQRLKQVTAVQPETRYTNDASRAVDHQITTSRTTHGTYHNEAATRAREQIQQWHRPNDPSGNPTYTDGKFDANHLPKSIKFTPTSIRSLDGVQLASGGSTLGFTTDAAFDNGTLHQSESLLAAATPSASSHSSLDKYKALQQSLKKFATHRTRTNRLALTRATYQAGHDFAPVKAVLTGYAKELVANQSALRELLSIHDLRALKRVHEIHDIHQQYMASSAHTESHTTPTSAVSAATVSNRRPAVAVTPPSSLKPGQPTGTGPQRSAAPVAATIPDLDTITKASDVTLAQREAMVKEMVKSYTFMSDLKRDPYEVRILGKLKQAADGDVNQVPEVKSVTKIVDGSKVYEMHLDDDGHHDVVKVRLDASGKVVGNQIRAVIRPIAPVDHTSTVLPSSPPAAPSPIPVTEIPLPPAPSPTPTSK